MPTFELVLCRGWRGVGAAAVQAIERRLERDPVSSARVLVLVPTAAAKHLFRIQLEERLSDHRSVFVLPGIRTPAELVVELADARRPPLRLVDPLLREALVEAAFLRAAEAGAAPPFTLRSGLASRVLELYDALLFSTETPADPTLEAFIARALEELDDPDDAGAVKLAAQTRFLEATFTDYRRELARLEIADPPEARRRLRSEPSPYEEVLVLGSETLTPLDARLLTSLRGLERATLLLPEPASFVPAHLERAFPERRAAPETSLASPRVLAPAEDATLPFVARDREEALLDVARLLKLLGDEGRRPRLDRVAVVVPRPLPYLYLAKKVFTDAGIPFQLQDSFPLATEPVLAAVDLVLDLVEGDAHRSSALALLRSPFYRFAGVGPGEVAAVDALTQRFRVPGGVRRWRSLLEREGRDDTQPRLPGIGGGRASSRPALEAIVDAAEALAPLHATGPMTAKIACLRSFLARFARSLAEVVPDSELARTERSRAAFDSILSRLAEAARQVGDTPIELHRFRAKLERAVGAHTFASRTGEGGVQVVDARSAGFGAFDLVLLLGLNEGEWPRRAERNIFYPQRLLREFGWASDRDVLARERQRFELLLELASEWIALFRHQLDEELPTVVSPFLEDAAAWLARSGGAAARASAPLDEIVVSRTEALRLGALDPSLALPRERRSGLLDMAVSVFEPISPTAIELYLRCPFKYLSRYLLGLEEEEEVDGSLTPLERGRILHDLLKDAFEAWDASGETPRPVAPASYDEALALFRSKALEKLPREHRSIELARLFGGPGDSGAIPWLLLRELDRGPLKRRLVEYGFESPLRLERGPRGQSPWYVRIRGRVDRADLDASGRLSVFDYKSGRAPAARTALQVPLYAMGLSQELSAPVREAAYLSFRDRSSASRADFEKASRLLAEAYEAISEGSLPPRPDRRELCWSCGYVGVCRKEIEEGEAGDS